MLIYGPRPWSRTRAGVATSTQHKLIYPPLPRTGGAEQLSHRYYSEVRRGNEPRIEHRKSKEKFSVTSYVDNNSLPALDRNCLCVVVLWVMQDRSDVAYMDRLPGVRLMGFSWADGDHNLPMMMVVLDSAGDAS
jgi:hypothetical protein